MFRDQAYTHAGFFFGFFLACLFPLNSMALSCAIPDLEQDYRASDYVFVGKVEGFEKLSPPGGFDLHADSVAKVSVINVYKGDLSKSIEISFNSYWGNPFQESETYLIFTQKKDSKIVTPLCSSTQLFSQLAKDDLKKLEQLSGAH